MEERHVEITRTGSLALAHYRLSSFREGNLPGVEQVMRTQFELLHDKNIPTVYLVGDTDIPEPEHGSEGIVVYSAIRMDEKNLGSQSEQADNKPSAEEIARGINLRIPDSGIIFHNTIQAARYNEHYGIAAARIVDQGVLGERPLCVSWVHDPVGSPHHIYPMLPTQNVARIAVISQTREKALYQLFDQMIQLGYIIPPNLDIRVIPNTFNSMYFDQQTAIPQTFTEFAPHFTSFTQREHLAQKATDVERLLTDNETLKLLLVGRPIHNKGVIEAMKMADALTTLIRQKVALVVTNAPDTDTLVNREYWLQVKSLRGKIHNDKLQIVFLGGVKSDYMKWLYERAQLLVAPFENEGFGLPPAEAALVGTPSVISDDPALQETTSGHAKTVERAIWQREPLTAAREVFAYLGSNEAQRDIKKIQHHIKTHYSPETITDSLLKIIE